MDKEKFKILKQRAADLIDTEPEKSIEIINELLVVDPNDVDLFYIRGHAWVNSNIMNAFMDFNRCLELDSSNSKYWAARGACCSKMNHLENALEDFDRCIKIDPSNIETLNNRAGVYCLLSRFKDAFDDLKKSMELDSNKGVTWGQKGSVHLRKGDFDEAIKCLQRSVDIDPNNRDAWINKGMAHENKKEYDDAINCYTKCILLNRDDTYAYIYRGRAYSHKRQYEFVLSDLNTAKDLGYNKKDIEPVIKTAKMGIQDREKIGFTLSHILCWKFSVLVNSFIIYIDIELGLKWGESILPFTLSISLLMPVMFLLYAQYAKRIEGIEDPKIRDYAVINSKPSFDIPGFLK